MMHDGRVWSNWEWVIRTRIVAQPEERHEGILWCYFAKKVKGVLVQKAVISSNYLNGNIGANLIETLRKYLIRKLKFFFSEYKHISAFRFHKKYMQNILTT